MQYTFHLTSACNLACRYCFVNQDIKFMSRKTAFRAIDLMLSGPPQNIGLGFYGGEPLICKDLIKEIVAYSKQKAKNTGHKIYFKLTTNGTLLDGDFLGYSEKENILIAISIDGDTLAHDINRVDHTGGGTYETLLSVIPMLLDKNPYTPAMMTVTKNNVSLFAQSVQHIYDLGFMQAVCSLDLSAQWDKKSLAELKGQYKKLSQLYYKKTMAEDKFYLSPFEGKISSHIQGNDYCTQRCKLGYEQISIGWDGGLYPCIRFADDKEYIIGDVITGINEKRRKEIYLKSRPEPPECINCAVKNRCLHTCACVNQYTTGILNEPSAVLCANERMLIPIADRLAEKLYKKRNGMFIQKNYNTYYSLVSLAEDRERKVSNETKNCKNCT